MKAELAIFTAIMKKHSKRPLLLLATLCLGAISAVCQTGEPDVYLIQRVAADSLERLMQRTGYVLSYNADTRNPHWVAWKLTAERLEEGTKRIDRFRSDPDLPRAQAVTPNNYNRSGWDKGHLCPAGDNTWSKEAMLESFYMTNMSPQHPNLNRGDWNELEGKCRQWLEKDSCLYIVAGPVFYEYLTPRTIGKDLVRVPDAFFKVILCLHGEPRAVGFVYPNERGNRPLHSYMTTVREVEQLTEIDFFSALPDSIEHRIESRYIPADWPE